MFEARFYETYYFCNIIRNVLFDQESFLRNLDEFHGDGRVFSFITPFRKYSALHSFIEFIVEDVYYEQSSEIQLETRRHQLEIFKDIPLALEYAKPKKLPIEHAFDFYNMDHTSFESHLESMGKAFIDSSEDDVYDYMADLRLGRDYENLLEKTVKEVFHVLFQNRSLLLEFNQMMANSLSFSAEEIPIDAQDSYFSRSGTLKRKNIPKWAKRAVYFRDRGRCVICNKDLSGMTNLDNVENYDHIVPLAKYGLNDVTNVQLLCKECNQNEKKAGDAVTSDFYQTWYKYD